MASVDREKVIANLLEDYYNLDINDFRVKLEENFRIFEDLENIEDPRTKAIGKFLYSVGLSILAGELQKYKFYETRFDMSEKAYQVIKESLEYFESSDELKILEHIYDHLIFLLWARIPYQLIIVDERLKLYEELIEYCKKQEEISSKLGDDAFLTRDERIPYRYTIGEFRYLLEKAGLSPEEALDSNQQLKEKIAELEGFDFPKAKFWARKWRHRHVCDIDGNTKISYYGGSLRVEGDEVEFSNNSFNRSIKVKMYIEPESEVLQQEAFPDLRMMRTRMFFSSLCPKIERKYDDLKLEFTIDRPYKSKGDAFARDSFSLVPQRAADKEYFLVIETTGDVDAQEFATLITEKDVTLRINDPASEVIEEEGITKIKFNLMKEITDGKGPKSQLPEKEELDYLGFGKSINFTLYCNINPTFSGTFIFTDPSNWKYSLAAALYMNKLKFKQEWYPSFLNFDYSPILFLEKGKIPQKFFNKLETGEYSGFLRDIGKEFPGLLEHLVIVGEFMGDKPLEERKNALMELIYMMSSISHLAIDEKSVITIITSNKKYYDEMNQIETELNKLNEKLTRIYKSKAASAIDIQYVDVSEFISNVNIENRKIYDRDYEEVYLIEDPILAFVLVPLVKYTQTAILTKDELGSDKTRSILTKAKRIWAIGDFEDVKIPKKATTVLTKIHNDDINEDISKINEIFRIKITEDYKKYAESNFLQRIYPGYNEKEILYNTILTATHESDYGFLTIACNYASVKPATINVIVDNEVFNQAEKEIMKSLKDLRFSEEKMINEEDILNIGQKIKSGIHPLIRRGIESSENIIIVTKVPIPFELYDLESKPICISKALGRVCSTDITDTSIMLTLNMMRRMITKTGEEILVIAPRYEGEMALPEATAEASVLRMELKRIFEKKVTAMIDEVINKDKLFQALQDPLKVIHFSGHGAFIDGKSALVLGAPLNKDPIFLFAEDLEKMVKTTGLIKGYPLIFTSACITGQIQEGGSGLEGLASEFVKSGATCFIGTLWEILDQSAREFATQLYSGLNEFDKSFGKIVLESRQLLYKKYVETMEKGDFFDPTCFAFIVFGDPTIKIK